MHLIARILNLKNRYQSVREFECTLIDLSGEKMKLSGKTYIKSTQIFKKHFLTIRYEYANEWVDDVIASQFSIHFVQRKKKSWYEGHTITSLGKMLKFLKFYVQNIWHVVRWWHHQLIHLHIHIDWSRNVLWKFAKLQSVITSLFFNRFSSGFHYYVWNFLLFLLIFKLTLFRISPLTQTAPIIIEHVGVRFNCSLSPKSGSFDHL